MNRVAFTIGGWTIYWYGIMVCIGFMVGIWNASRRALKTDIDPSRVVDLGTWLLLGAIVGARLLYVVSYWNEFAGKPLWEIFMIHHGGLVFFGGLLGAIVSTVFYCKIKKINVWNMADVLAPSIPLGHFFGRIGCFLNGCCFGKQTTLPWAVHFPEDHPTCGVGVHPTQLYEAGFNLLIFFGLQLLFKNRRFKGQIFSVYLILYGIGRSLIECFRGDYEKLYFGGLITPGQLASLVALVSGIIIYNSLKLGIKPNSQ